MFHPDAAVRRAAPSWTWAPYGSWHITGHRDNLPSSGRDATPYFAGDNVLFDDTAGTAGTTAVTPAGARRAEFRHLQQQRRTPTRSAAPAKSPASASLAVTGSGLVVLATDNDYTGGTTISAGTLQLGNGGTTGSVPRAT